MKIFLIVILAALSIESYGQDQKVAPMDERPVPEMAVFPPPMGLIREGVEYKIVADTTSYESEYFAVYLNIQTSDIKPSQVEFAKKIVKFVKQNHGVVYINVQSGIPPCVPTPTRPCPKE